MQKSNFEGRLVLAGAVAAVALSIVPQAQAATFTFTGTTAGTYDWDAPSTGWSGTPVSSLDTTLAYSGTLADGAAIISNNNIVATPFQLNGLSFTNAGTLPTTLTESLTLQGGQLEFVTDSLAATPTIAVNLGATPPGITINNDLLLTNNLGVSGASSVTIGGVISGGGTLTKTGAGTLTLRGNNNTYGGGVVINAGTVNLTLSASALGTTAVNLGGASSSATLHTNAGINVANAIIVNPTSAGTLSLLNNASGAQYSGPITLGHALTIAVGGSSTNRSVVASGLITGSSTITTSVNSGGSVQITNVGNASTFSGNVLIAQRVLLFNNGSLGTGGTITFGSGTLPELRWNTGNTEDVSSRLVLPTSASGTARLDTGVNNVAFANGLSGASGITKLGAGILTMNGSSSYAGATTVSAGTLKLGAANRIDDLSDLAMAGGTFNTDGFSETMDLLLLSANSTIDFGAGASILNLSGLGAFDTTKVLNLVGWSGLNTGSGTDRLFIGASAILTPEQLAAIKFVDPTNYDPGTYGATQLGSGEIVIVPEPASLGLLAMAGLGLLRRRRT